MSIEKKYTQGIVKEFDRKAVEASRTIEFVISSSTKDRYKSVVNMDGWEIDNFNKNGIVGYQHNVYGGNMCTPDDPDDVIGQGRAWIEGTGERAVLMGSVTFEPVEINPKAEKIFRKVLAGTLKATSVGFLEIGEGEWESRTDEKGNVLDRTYRYKGQELLEFSIVNIPANPDAVARQLSVQADWALAYVMRFVPETMSMKDIREMKVGDVMDLVQNKTKKEVEESIKDNTGLKRRYMKSKMKSIKI
jgi:hypothetical protein